MGRKPAGIDTWGAEVAAVLEARSKSLAFQLANHKMLMAYLEKHWPRLPSPEGREIMNELHWRPK